ncbi:MAG: glycerol-3-phosphate dehydrogenase subunit GlpB [Anaerolineae bacterium]
MSRYDVVVIGAGLAGLTTACQLAQNNQKVLVTATGIGALLLASGCIDVLGFQPADSMEPVKNPASKLDDFLAERPNHPYGLVGRANLEAGLNNFLKLVNQHGLDYQGDFNHNWLLPSAAGAVHPTCLAPASLAKGELSTGESMLIVGFSQMRDFYPTLISQNLNEQDLVKAEPCLIDVTIPRAGKVDVVPTEVGHAFERAEFRREVIKAVKSKSKGYQRIGFPAMLGLRQHREVVADLEKGLDKPVFEISALPPSIPGRRLYEALKEAFLQAGGKLILSGKIVAGTIEGGRVTQVQLETISRLKPIQVQHYVLATGGLFGGGLMAHQDGRVTEQVFGLPITAETNRHKWFNPHFVSPQGQPVFNYGVKVNERLNPVNGSAVPLAENLYAVGAILAESEWAHGRTGDGLAVATAAAVVKQITGNK